MASRMMHYTIAKLIADSIDIIDKHKFILGNLEPDLSCQEDGSYNIAHFVRKNDVLMTKGMDWVQFAEHYQDSILRDDEVLGYFVHLITDACWVKHIRDKYIRKYPKEQRHMLTAKGYRDMYKYNGLLINKYQLKNTIHKIDKLEVTEASIKYKEYLINGLISDFAGQELLDHDFEIYPYEEVMAFIHLSVEKSILEINALKTHQELGDPEVFYVSQ